MSRRPRPDPDPMAAAPRTTLPLPGLDLVVGKETKAGDSQGAWPNRTALLVRPIPAKGPPCTSLNSAFPKANGAEILQRARRGR